MSSLSRLKASPGLLIRALVALGAVAAIATALANIASGRPAFGADAAEELVVLVILGALARRFGIALPGNGFTSYILGVMACATLDRGWAFGVLVGPAAMLAGDVALRRLPLAAALDNAAHLTAGGAVAGLVYERLDGATGAAAIAAPNLPTLAVFLLLLPVVVNATFYLELALGRSLAWVDPRLTARWEAVVYACSAGLALGWLALMHASVDTAAFLVIGAGLAGATVAALAVVRRAVRADELALIQGLGQVIARDISLARSFPRIQELARRLVPWEHMGFARYDAATNEMELIADTAARPGARFRYDANAGLTGEVLRLRRPVVARALARQQVVAPGGEEQPGSEAAGRGGRGSGRRDPRVGRADGADDGEDPARHAGGGAPTVGLGPHHRRERARGAPPAGRGGAGREILGNDRLHREPDEPAGAQRDHRGGPRRRAWSRLRGRGR